MFGQYPTMRFLKQPEVIPRDHMRLPCPGNQFAPCRGQVLRSLFGTEEDDTPWIDLGDVDASNLHAHVNEVRQAQARRDTPSGGQVPFTDEPDNFSADPSQALSDILPPDEATLGIGWVNHDQERY